MAKSDTQEHDQSSCEIRHDFIPITHKYTRQNKIQNKEATDKKFCAWRMYSECFFSDAEKKETSKFPALWNKVLATRQQTNPDNIKTKSLI